MNELKQIFRRAIFVMLSMILLVAVTACKQDGEYEEEQSETIVTRYSYNLTANDKYYIVHEYNCVDAGNNSYTVKNYAVHYFSKTETYFKNKTGSDLVWFVKNGTYAPSASKSYTRDTATKATVTNDSTGVKIYYNMAAGISYTVYQYW